MPPPSQWDLHAFKVDRICDQAIEELRVILMANPTMTRVQLRHVIKRINDRWGGVAAQDAADTMVSVRAEMGVRGLPDPTPVTVVSEEMADALARYAKAGETSQQVLERAAASMNRTVRNASRYTVLEGTRSARTRFARVPKVGACAFCLMLASRGGVYSRDTVRRTESGDRYHDNCHCGAMEILRDEQEPEISRALSAEWERTRDERKEGAQWGDVVHESRMHDRADRKTMEYILELQEGVRFRAGRVMQHISTFDAERGRGGHLRKFLPELQKLVVSGVVELKEGKSFFPDADDAALMQWLGDADSGAVVDVVEDPDLRVFSETGKHGYVEKDVVFQGRRIRLRIFLTRAPSRKAKKWGVATVYPVYGDGVVKLLPDGSVIDMLWQEPSQ